MSSVKILALAGAAAAMSTAAFAADFPPALPPAQPLLQVPVDSGWYLRGDIGITNQQLSSLTQRLDATELSLQQVGMGFDSSPFFLLGVGYQLNSWLRFDVTGEYRAKANFHGSDNVTFPDAGGVGVLVDNYSASKSEWVVLANSYIDLGTWWSMTPFVGAGVGVSRNQIDSFRDDGIGFHSNGNPITAVAFGDQGVKWNLAWALHAGVAYTVTPNFKIDLAYRYLNLGIAQTGLTRAFDNSFTNGGAFSFNGLASHDVMLGVRWMIQPEAPVYAPPLIRKG
jgi:opacity protein-like surface antigen